MDQCTPGKGKFCMLIQASMIEMSRGSIRTSVFFLVSFYRDGSFVNKQSMPYMSMLVQCDQEQIPDLLN
jgi:hypothetical protein